MMMSFWYAVKGQKGEVVVVKKKKRITRKPSSSILLIMSDDEVYEVEGITDRDGRGRNVRYVSTRGRGEGSVAI